MPAIIIPNRTWQQPRGPIEVSGMNSLASGLTCVLTPSTTGSNSLLRNLVSQQNASHDTVSLGYSSQLAVLADSYGRYWQTIAGATGFAWSTSTSFSSPKLTGDSVFSMAVVGARSSTQADQEPIFQLFSSGARVNLTLRNIYQPGGGGTMGHYTGGSEDQRSIGVNTPALDERFAVVMSYTFNSTTASTIRYQNGLIATGTGTALNPTTTLTGSPFYFSLQRPKIYGVFVWNRVLSSAEQRDWVKNPWQIFQPTSTRVYSFSTSTAYTLTADGGTLNLSGQAATVKAGRTIVADQGTFNLAGQEANFINGHKIIADRGTLTISGQNAALVYSAAVASIRTSVGRAGVSVTYKPT